MPPPTPTRVDDTGFFGPYAEYAKVLRTWFVAYGVGALALLLSNSEIRKAALSADVLQPIARLVMLGTGIQVVAALLYKHAMWHLYCGDLEVGHKQTRWYKMSDWISESHLLELAADVGTIGCFSWATWLFFGLQLEATN